MSVRGPEAASFLNHALTSDVLALARRRSPTHAYFRRRRWTLTHAAARNSPISSRLHLPKTRHRTSRRDWLAALSDAYVLFDDLYAKLSGPVVAEN